MITNLRLTILIENTVFKPRLLAEHGLSIYLECETDEEVMSGGGKRTIRLLFDAGQSGAVAHNARQLGIDLAALEAVVISHGHYDHTGGLPVVLEQCPQARLFLSSQAMEVKYSTTRGHIHPVGLPPAARQAIERKQAAGQVVWTDQLTRIEAGRPDIWVTGAIVRRHACEDLGGLFVKDEQGTIPDPIGDDQALVIETYAGAVVFLGCGHAGVINTLSQIQAVRQQADIYALFGGLHLSGGTPQRLGETVTFLETLNLKMAGPVHCSGAEAMQQMMRLATHFHRLGTGSAVEI